ncbi:MAG: methyl-accepting chemotaxis protein [Peptostreptococcales bacterium]
MSWFLNRKIGAKVIVGFVLVALIAGVVGLVGIVNIKEINNANTRLFEENLIPIQLMGDMTQAFQRMRVNIYVSLLAPTAEERAAAIQAVNARRAEFLKAYEAFESIPMSLEVQKAYDEFAQVRIVYGEKFDQLIRLINEERIAEAIFYASEEGEFGKIAREEQDRIVNLVHVKTEEAQRIDENNNEIVTRATMTMIAILLGAVLISILLGITLGRIISKPLKRLTYAAQKLSVGDIDVEITSKTKDEVGMLSVAFSEMIENIKKQSSIVEKIATGSFDVDIPIRSDKDVLNKNIMNMNLKIKKMRQDVKQIIENIEVGKFRMENNLKDFEGGWKEIVSGIYHITSSFVCYFDSLPIIVMTVDKEYGINFINKTGADMSQTDIHSVLGIKCHDYWKTDDCKTEKCYCHRAMTDNRVSTGDNICHAGKEPLHIYCSGIPMTDGQGNITGALEIILDQTDIKLAQVVADKKTRYQEIEVNKLVNNLNLLAQGNLNIKTSLADYDGDTEEIAKNFKNINASLEASSSEIKSYIDELSSILFNMANKDFTDNIERKYLGDFIKLKDSINNIIESLNEVFSEFNDSAEQVESAADQVASSSQTLSQGSAEQAGSVEEISASINEVAEQTKDNAESAYKANELSVKSKEDAQIGNKQMNEMLVAMNEIKESSKGISKIIKVIDEIAFQTNILALNAAVEAARAGEHGKGFAVVAEEVRNLAARSAKAAKETTDLIDNSIHKTEEGYKMAHETAQAFEKIVTGVTNVVDIVSQIATASSEQTSAIEEVNQGIEQISQVTQSNTATAEESASASEEMAGQAQVLKNLIQEYKLKNSKIKRLTTKKEIKLLEKQQNRKENLQIVIEDNFGKY